MAVKKPAHREVDKVKDWADRALGAFLTSWLSLVTVAPVAGINVSTLHALEAAAGTALFATVKTLVGQRYGDGTGSMFPVDTGAKP